MSNTLKIYRINPDVVIPKKATAWAACFDLRAYIPDGSFVEGFCRDNIKRSVKVSERGVAILPGDRLMIPTGLIFDIPEGHSVRIHPRSGMALKQGLILANCEAVIDADYVNETMILIHNTSNVVQTIEHGERLCQAELVKDLYCTIEETVLPPEQKTERVGGLGHTGKD